MRKKFLFAAMAVAALASCSNDDVVDMNKGNAISFRASLDRPTRANVTKLSNLGSFHVVGLKGSDEYLSMAVTSNDGGNTWETETHYWPGNDQLAFFAYSPQTPSGTVGITNTAKKITGFSPAQAVAEQKDLVISYNTGTKAANENSGVPMNFKHALSQIEVQAKCSNANIKIEVIGVKLENAAAKADFTFPETETKTTYTLQQDKWNNWSEKNVHEKAYMVHGDNALTLTNAAQSIMFGDNNFMLIPQQLTKWDGSEAKTGAYLSVLCRISNLNNGEETLLYPQPVDGDTKSGKYAFAAVGIETNWLPGKKYIYTLNFCAADGGAGEIDPNPTAPTNDPSNPTIDPDPVTGGKGGDPILSKPIKFTVTVENWVDADPVEINM